LRVYIEHIERNDATMKTKAKHDMTKRNTKSNETPSIVLKTIHDDIMRDNANATITTKRMRVWLRANMRDVHEHNASWIFTQSQYDIVRSHFDAKYRARIERAAKRENATPRKRRAKSNVETSNDANVTTNENA
jgi:hypothetical protein